MSALIQLTKSLLSPPSVRLLLRIHTNYLLSSVSLSLSRIVYVLLYLTHCCAINIIQTADTIPNFINCSDNLPLVLLPYNKLTKGINTTMQVASTYILHLIKMQVYSSSNKHGKLISTPNIYSPKNYRLSQTNANGVTLWYLARMRSCQA